MAIIDVQSELLGYTESAYKKEDPSLVVLPDLSINPMQAEHDDFYAYTENFILITGDRLCHRTLGKLIIAEGLPEGMERVDGWRSGMQTTSLSLDVSQWRKGTFTWFIESNGISIEKNRRLTVSESRLYGEIDYRRLLPSVGGTTEILDEQRLSALIKVTRNLGDRALSEINKPGQMMLPFWPYI